MRLARPESSKSFDIFLSVALFSAYYLYRFGKSLKIEAGVAGTHATSTLLEICMTRLSMRTWKRSLYYICSEEVM